MNPDTKAGARSKESVSRHVDPQGLPGSELAVLDARQGRIAKLPALERRVLREAILALARGKEPSAADLADRSGSPVEPVRRALAALDARDFIALRGDTVRVAYPFTADGVPHEVESSGGLARANCAIDALGAGAMLGETVQIRSHCSHCGAPIHLRGRDDFRGTPEAPVVFLPPIEALEGEAVEGICPSINFYCDSRHGRDDTSAWADRGRLLSIEEATARGIAVFGTLLDSLR